MRALPLGAKRERSRQLRRKSVVLPFAREYFKTAHSPFLQEAKYCQIGLRCGKLRFPLRELLLKNILSFVIPSLSRDLN